MPYVISKNVTTGEESTVYIVPTKEELIDSLKSKRDSHWLKGALLPTGLRIQTDSESVSSLLGAIKLAEMEDETFRVNWSLGNGAFLQLSLSDLLAIGQIQGRHIQAVQTRFATLRQQIDQSNTDQEIEATESAFDSGWPE